jgi:opacity protein-like surface antigen
MRTRIQIFVVVVLVNLAIDFDAFSQTVFPIVGITMSRTTLASQVPDPYDVTMKIKTGFAAGAGLEYPFGKKFYAQSGLVYIQKGQRSSTQVKTNNSEYFDASTYQLNYLELPIQARVILANKNDREFYVKIGVNISYFLSGKLDYTYTNILPFPGQGSGSRPIVFEEGKKGTGANEYYIENRYDVGVYAGIGMKVSNRINIDLGFTQGTIGNALLADRKGVNQVLQLMVSSPIRMAGSKKSDQGN